MLDLRQLSCFTAAYRFKSISKAAESMYISQQAVSHNLRELEKALGGALFTRFSGGVQPTALGDKLYSDAEKLLNACAAFEEKAAAVVRRREGLFFAYADGVFNVSDAANLDDLCQYVQNELHLPVTLLERTTVECYNLLESEQADIICIFNPKPENDFVAEVLKSYPLYVGMAATHPLAGKKEITLSQMREYSTIADPRDEALNSTMAALIDSHGSRTNAYTPSVQLSSFKDIMRRDNSFLMFTLPFLRTYAGEDAVILPSPINDVQLKLCTVFRKDSPYRQKLSRLVDYLKKHYACVAD